MDVALVKFVGAGLTYVLDGFEEEAPQGAVASGFQLIRHLAAGHVAGVVPLVEDAVSSLWREWRTAGLPAAVAEQHLEAMPELLEAFRAPRGALIAIATAMHNDLKAGVKCSPHATRVVMNIIGQARTAGTLSAAGLNEQVAFFFLDRLLTRLLTQRKLIGDLRPVFRRYLELGAWRPDYVPASAGPEPDAAEQTATAVHPETAPAAPEKQQEPADPAPARPPQTAIALEHLLQRAGDRDRPVSAQRREELTRGLDVLVALLHEAVDGDAEAMALKREALQAIEIADFAEADVKLAAAEDLHIHAAPVEFGNGQQRLTAAAAIRAMRAEIEELCSNWRRAARHLGTAARCLPESDRMGRHRYLLAQARALSRHAEASGESSALHEATQAYSDAIRLVTEADAPAAWAAANLALGNLLLEIGEREGRTERFLAAAVHLRPTLDVFSRLKQQDDWARAQLGLAHALSAQGQVQGDVATLMEAAFAYRASLGVASLDRMPVEWQTAQFHLADTLMRLGQETGESLRYREASAALRAAMAAADGDRLPYTRASIGVRLGHATLLQGQSPHEENALVIAVETFAAVLEDPNATAAESVAAKDGIGTGLKLIGVARKDMGLLAEAAEMKLAALDGYEALGDDDNASAVRIEMAELKQLLPPAETPVEVAGGDPAGPPVKHEASVEHAA